MNKGGWKIAAAVAVIVLAAVFSYIPFKKDINLGLDLRGGAEVVLQAVAEDGGEVTDEDMSNLKDIMNKRVNEIGVSEPIIQISGKDRLLIELAGVDNPDDAIAVLGETAKMEFVDPEGNVVVSGSDLKDAQGVKTSSGQVVISLQFTDEGTKKFADATTRFVGQEITILLDNKVLMSPTVEEPILNGQAQITGNYTLEEAIQKASILRGGALPVNVEVMAKRTVGPSLGADSLNKSLYAGILGMILLSLYIMIYYRLPGVVAIVSLAFYGLVLIWLMISIGVVITLPGIAGFVLSIGMAVDANIIIYERLREELHNGKSLRAAIEAGFNRALWTILDSNITTLLAAAVLFKFGTGSIQGFAVTLSLGILVSMLSALVVTRFLLIWSADVRLFNRHLSWYAGRRLK